MNWRIILAAVLIASAPAVAQATPCVNPPGDEGDQVYNITYHVMQYCNGSHWVAMGSHSGSGGGGSDNLGNHMAEQALDMGGFRIQNLAPPTADNHAVTRAYVTSAIAAIPAPTTPNLSAVLATGNAAGNRKITGLATPTVGTDAAHKTYVDGKFGTLTNSRWCRTDGTRVICDQVAPSGGTDNLGNHTATTDLIMSSKKITDLATPTAGTDAAHKAYVDGKFGALTSNKWCRGSGTQVICDQDEPAGGGGSPCSPANVQTFNANGTWTKPVCGTFVKAECWGGGGSGGVGSGSSYGGGGGGGGGYDRLYIVPSALPTTVAITVGSGGASRSSGDGRNGGDSSFGTFITALGGSAGTGGQGGAGGEGGFGLDRGGSGGRGQGPLWTAEEGKIAAYSGGGGGGAGSGSSSTNGGTSAQGGNGGNGGNSGGAGAVPGGGGGGARSGSSGAGGRGRCIVTTY